MVFVGALERKEFKKKKKEREDLFLGFIQNYILRFHLRISKETS